MSYSGKKGTAEPQTGKRGSSAKASTEPPVLFIPADVEQDPVALMQLASKLSLDSGNFVDTKFYAFSRRKASGTIYAPKAIYANSWILRAKSPQYIENLLFEGYDANCTIGPLDSAIPSYRECLGKAKSTSYDSDSDIEDDDDDMEASRKSALGAPSTKDGRSTPVSHSPVLYLLIADCLNAGSQGTSQLSPSQAGFRTGRRIPAARTERPDYRAAELCLSTWKAFVYYLYTGKIEFARLKSQKPAIQPLAKTAQMSTKAPPCSPKFMYKLADESCTQLGISELKNLAQADIQSKLSGDNILAELSSTFTSRYDDIRDMEITLACDQTKDALKAGMSSWMNAMPANILKCNATVIGLLVEKLAATVTPAPAPASCRYCGNRGRNGFITHF
ncbi:uncharacterized protein PHACADRAFT_183507 [Phanerochaete carnosa HHB-10118-sp]|uniref:BTB domain-containing protein n=1 Tax=Phanerochaete carnosa (strain HHB-10118-sp) TaxID=650164 RepID=K5WCH7_PHACS|nr:uncharacterized protein PHACADRAFT_183507 [Phanerochaete carnosa HHB-10118-sp]EKM56940.1 hypothetical protein PHACADRAFT_183507 [Phanerochaete carnosa HHB-10118-sp]